MHSTLCDFILDIVQNAVEAGSSVVGFRIMQDERSFSVRIDDNGSGMTSEELERALDPFHNDGKKHRNRKVGLGLPFLRQAIGLTDGKLDIQSEKNTGTSISFSFPLDHLDTPPVGDLCGTVLQALMFEGDYEMVVHRVEKDRDRTRDWSVRRSEIREALGDLSESGSLLLLRDFLESQENGAES